MRLVRKASLLLAAVCSATLTVILAVEPAYAESPAPIVNPNSGMCLQPYPVQTFPGEAVSIHNNGVPVAQLPCNGSQAQQWLLVSLGSDHNPNTGSSNGFPELEFYYKIINVLTLKCLDVKDANPNDRADIQQYECNGGRSETWFAHPNPNGYVQYTNRRTGRCLDVPFASTDPTLLWQFHCTSNNVAQQFTYRP